jgi:5-hydroxyisourate hydrolase
MVGGKGCGLSRLSTHVLDTTLGRPASGIAVHLEYARASGNWLRLATQTTDGDGRCANLLPSGFSLEPGQIRLRFETEAYHAAQSVRGLYPVVEITVTVRAGDSHLHIPLLLSPNGYTTYKGT